MLNVLVNYLKEPCFNRLRTDEQLGYIVNGTDSNIRGVLGYYIYVQSSVKWSHYLSERVLAFIDHMREKIKDLSDDEFKKHVESVKTKNLQKDLSIYEEAERYWVEVTTHRFLFNKSK